MRPLPAVVYREHSPGPAPGQALVNGLVIFLAICTILHFGADILIPVALAILLSILLAPMVGAAAPAAAEGGGGDGRARRAELLGGAFRLCTPPTAPRAAPAAAAASIGAAGQVPGRGRARRAHAVALPSQRAFGGETCLSRTAQPQPQSSASTP